MSASVVSPVFVGRQDEIAALTALLDRVQDGEPAFALIGGEAGVGKTRFAAEGTIRAGATYPPSFYLLLVIAGLAGPYGRPGPSPRRARTPGGRNRHLR